MTTQNEIVTFYESVLNQIKSLHDYPTASKELYSSFRYRVSNPENCYSVVIPSTSFGTKTTEFLTQQFEKSRNENMVYMIDAKHLVSSDVSGVQDVLSRSTKAPFFVPTPKKGDEPVTFEHAQSIKGIHLKLSLITLKLERETDDFMLGIEYVLPDNSCFYVLYNKQGIELLNRQKNPTVYPISDVVADMKTLYYIKNAKSQYDSSFSDLRNRK